MTETNRHPLRGRHGMITVLLIASMWILAGCGIIFGDQETEPEPEATEDRVLVPTFTPTPEGFVDESAPAEGVAEEAPAATESP